MSGRNICAEIAGELRQKLEAAEREQDKWKEEARLYAINRDQALEKLAAARVALEEVRNLEWGDDGQECRFCFGVPPDEDPDDGHASNCPLAVALEAQPSTEASPVPCASCGQDPAGGHPSLRSRAGCGCPDGGLP